MVVFQSDDWGHACVENIEQHHRINNSGVARIATGWAADALESGDDVRALSSVLTSFKDCNGRSARFTLNFIVERPDYEHIEYTGLQGYRTIPVSPARAILDMAGSSSPDAVFEVQFHGAEHVAPARWLRLLREGASDLRSYFQARAMPPPSVISKYPGLGAAYLACPDDVGGVDQPPERLRSGLRSFRKIFSRQAYGFVAPNHAWDVQVEDTLAAEGIRYFQACHVHYGTWAASEAGRWRAMRSGVSARSDIWRQTRNVEFEPAIRPDHTALQISRACALIERGIPVVINTHRANYVRALDAARAARALERLGDLLRSILATRSDVHFLGSDEFDSVLRGSHPTIRRRWLVPGRNLPFDMARSALRPHRN